MVAAAALALIIFAVGSAQADQSDTPLQGTASLSTASRHLTVGTDSDVVLTVTAAGVKPVDWIRILPADGITLKPSGAAGTSMNPQSTWTPGAVSGNAVLFTGGQAVAGRAEEFTIPVTANSVYGTPATKDFTATWTIEASFDNGVHKRIFVPAAASALDSRMHVIELVEPFAITAPAAAKNGVFSAGQPNLELNTAFRNHAAGSITFTATVTATNATPSAAWTVTLPAGGQQAHLFTATAGTTVASKASFALVAETADKSSAIIPRATGQSQIQEAVGIVCAAFSPLSTSGVVAPHFIATLTRTGTPTADFNATLNVASSVPFGSTVPVHLPLGLPNPDDNVATAVDFGALTVTGNEGQVNVTVALAGADGNGAPISRTLSCGTIRIDRSAAAVTIDPLILPTMNLGSNPDAVQTKVKGADEVAFHGTINDQGGCSGSVVATGEVQQLAGDGRVLALTPVDTSVLIVLPATCGFDGSVFLPDQLEAGAVTIRARFVVIDGAGNASPDSYSPITLIDLTTPSFTAKTVGLTLVEARFSECLFGTGFGLGDWSIDGVPARGVTVIPCPERSGGPSGLASAGVRLDLSSADQLRSPNATPAIGYRVPIHDAFGLLIGMVTKKDLHFLDAGGKPLAVKDPVIAADATAAPSPSFVMISPGATPSFTIGNLTNDETVCVYLTSVASANQLGCAATPASAVTDVAGRSLAAQEPTITITSSRVFTQSGDFAIEVISTDRAGNVSLPSSAILHLDLGGPSISTATAAAAFVPTPAGLQPDASVTIRFNRDIKSGDDSASDWSFADNKGRPISGLTVQGVVKCTGINAEHTDRSCRRLLIDSAGSTAWRSIATVTYAPKGAAYRDDNGNTSVAMTRPVALSNSNLPEV